MAISHGFNKTEAATSVTAVSYTHLGYDEVYLDDTDNTTKPLIPDNMVVMIPSTANFMRAYGPVSYTHLLVMPFAPESWAFFFTLSR